MDALHVREPHLDLLALAARDLEGGLGAVAKRLGEDAFAARGCHAEVKTIAVVETDTANVIGSDRLGYPYPRREWRKSVFPKIGGTLMKIWNKPQVSEQSVGLEVTSYMPAEVDII